MYTLQQNVGGVTPEETERIIAEQRGEISGTPENLEEQATFLDKYKFLFGIFLTSTMPDAEFLVLCKNQLVKIFDLCYYLSLTAEIVQKGVNTGYSCPFVGAPDTGNNLVVKVHYTLGSRKC